MPESTEFTSIGIVFAMEIESRGLKRVLSQSRRVQSKHSIHTSWQMGNVRIITAVSGIGQARATDATEGLIVAGARAIINSGFAAALDGKASVGDVVIANRVLRLDVEDDPLVCDQGLRAAVPPSGSLGYGIWQSDVMTSDRMILDPEEKRLIYASTGAAALDMECYAAAQACASREVPFMSVKAVSDTASDALPRELTELMAIPTPIRQATFVLRRPSIWCPLWQLRKSALKASDNLGDALGMMLLRLSKL